MNDMTQRVLDLLSMEPFRALKAKEIQRRLEVPQHQYAALRKALRSLVQEGRLYKIGRNRYAAARKANEVVGELRVNSQGYGFVSADGKDIFISSKNMGKALHKDRVRVRLFAQTSGKNVEGQVVEVLERARNTVVGVFRWGRRFGYVVPDDLKLHKDIIISPGDDAGAQEGQKVVCEIDSWDHYGLSPYGRVVEILGYPEEPGVDILSVIHAHELPLHFPSDALRQADALPDGLPKVELRRRLDLRDQIVFTIDPDDAKDFDDAVSLEPLPDGNWLLGVHIADVSYYVAEGSPLDRVAAERGTSVYLVDRVIPMLPERLSNGLCSLAEGVDRPTFSVLMTLTGDGSLLHYELKESVIRSKKRFTYREAQQVLDGELQHPFSETLRNMAALAENLVALRIRRGSIDFDTLEVQVVLDANGEPVEIRPRERLFTNRLIEEFMLLANETVAKHVGVVLKKAHNKELPFVYRIHEKPDEQSVRQLVRLARAFGISAKEPQKMHPRYFAHLAREFQRHPAAYVLQTALLRTMMKAQYSPDNIGHFGLAYRYYTHFTSPIRRYPDLLVHRLLKKYLAGQFDFSETATSRLEKLCRKATECEIRAQEAERDSIKLKQLQYLEKHMGEEFDGIIVRMVNFGFFVELPQLLIEGLVHVTSLGDDYYIMDEEGRRLEGQYTGRVFTLGDPVRVRLARVDRNEKLVDFFLCEDSANRVPRKRNRR
ncbi:MAG: ribonuclease R [candidate division KSB1 bacterium]|nr:ribonuclease R [candidate division KSB1 bacterium]